MLFEATVSGKAEFHSRSGFQGQGLASLDMDSLKLIQVQAAPKNDLTNESPARAQQFGILEQRATCFELRGGVWDVISFTQHLNAAFPLRSKV